MESENIPKYDFKNHQTRLGLEVISLDRIRDYSIQQNIKAHRLNFYQIIIITGGSGSFEVDFEKIQYTTNTIIPVAQGQVQKFDFALEIDGYAVLFTPEFLINEEMDYHFLYNYIIFLHSIKPICLAANNTILALLDEMRTEQDLDHAFDAGEYQRNLLKNLLILTERTKREKAEIVCNDSLNLFMKFRKELEANISYKTKVADICDTLNITAKQLNGAVKLFARSTAKQFIDDRIILEIKRLLTYSSLSVKEIAYEIGFEDPTNFTKYFKARVNMLPTEYQKMQQ